MDVSGIGEERGRRKKGQCTNEQGFTIGLIEMNCRAKRKQERRKATSILFRIGSPPVRLLSATYLVLTDGGQCRPSMPASTTSSSRLSLDPRWMRGLQIVWFYHLCQ